MKQGIYYVPNTDELYIYEGGTTGWTDFLRCVVHSFPNEDWVYVGEL